NDQDEDCPICLNPIFQRCKPSHCFHYFCLNCLIEWVKLKNTCPVCVRPFLSVCVVDLDQTEVNRFHVFPENCSEWYDIKIFDDSNATPISIDDMTHSEYNEFSTNFRKIVYRRGIYGKITNQVMAKKSMNLLPEFLKTHPALLHRIIPFISRDLQAIFDENFEELHFLKLFILSQMQESYIFDDEFENQLNFYLGSKSKHFIHELALFCNSLMFLKEFDQNVVYEDFDFDLRF
ncbi:MAG: hypothetical protein MHPSP_001537, partial [Paramarteilia canceri]